MTIAETLSAFISDDLLETDEPVAADENLLADDMIDSLGMLRLIAFIEATYSVRVPPEDFTVENFRTIAVLAEYLATLAGRDGS